MRLALLWIFPLLMACASPQNIPISNSEEEGCINNGLEVMCELRSMNIIDKDRETVEWYNGER